MVESFSVITSLFFKEKAVIHESGYPYTPQQNSRVERKHGNLLNVARSLKIQDFIPDVFWGDCGLTSCYLINRTPFSLF